MLKIDTHNIILSSLSESELTELFFMINKMPLLFRDKLDLPPYISFGNEIEVENLNYHKAMLIVQLFNDVYALDKDSSFDAHEDSTVSAEIITPILSDSSDNWNLFKEMYHLLWSTGADIATNTSSHVHYGTHMIDTPSKLSLLLKTLVVFEPIIFKFGYGESDRPRELLTYRSGHVIFSPMMNPQRVKRFTNVLDNYNYNNIGYMNGEFNSFLYQDLHSRPVFNFNNFDFNKIHYGISFDKPQSTDHIEVRCNNGTLKPEIAQNNISLVAHIIWAVNEGRIDEEYIKEEYKRYQKKKYHFDYPYMIIDYEPEGIRYNRLLNGFNEIKMDKALKLADMIFENDIDKFYFLKQYLKLFSRDEEYIQEIKKKLYK